MKIRYIREQLSKFTNEEILERTKGRVVDLHLNNGHWTQLCVNDLQGFDNEGSYLYTRTGIMIRLQDLDSIEVIDSTSNSIK